METCDDRVRNINNSNEHLTATKENKTKALI